MLDVVKSIHGGGDAHDCQLVLNSKRILDAVAEKRRMRMYGGLKAASRWVAEKRSERNRAVYRTIPCRSGKIGWED
jgi:hypothetical protein